MDIIQWLSTTTLPEILGMLFGFLGAGILATHSKYSWLGWPTFFVSQVFWGYLGFTHNLPGLLLMEGVFFIIDSFGLYRSLKQIKEGKEVQHYFDEEYTKMGG